MAFYKSMIYDSIDVNDIIFAKYCYPNNFNIGTTVLRTSVPYSPVVTVKYLGV